MEKNSRGKFNSVVVKNAMSAINNSPNKKVRQYAKDFQSALFVENLAVTNANTGDLEELEHGLEKIHHEPKSQHSQKSQGSERYDKTSGEREQEAH